MIRFLAALVAALIWLSAAPVEAHRPGARDGSAPVGISIPSLTHGQMAVISDNLSAIRALASARIGFDMTTWRMEDYLNLQSFACLWGLAPGAISDEQARSTNAPTPILPPGGRFCCSCARRRARTTKRSML